MKQSDDNFTKSRFLKILKRVIVNNKMRVFFMKQGIHPKVFEVVARCACGSNFKTISTVESIVVDICSQCHPLFTGSQKFVDTAGNIEKFQRRYAIKTPKSKPKQS